LRASSTCSPAVRPTGSSCAASRPFRSRAAARITASAPPTASEFGRGYLIGGVDYTHRNEFERGDRDYLLCPEEFITFRDGTRADVVDPRTGQPRCNASFANSLQISAQPFVTRAAPGVTFSNVIFGAGAGQFGCRPSRVCRPASSACRPAPRPPRPSSKPSAASAPVLPIRVRPLIGGVSVQPKLDRYTAFLDGGFDITDRIELSAEFLFNRRETESQGFRQLFFSQFSASGTTGNNRPVIRCTPAQQVTRPNCDPTSPGDPINAGFVGNFFITPVIGVPSDNATKVDYYRGVLALRAEDLGGLIEGWNFDSYFQYSRSDGDYTNGRILTGRDRAGRIPHPELPAGQVTRIRGVPCQNIDFTDPRVIAGQFTPQEAPSCSVRRPATRCTSRSPAKRA
jgi:iron complex outermembrane receptor protein